METKLSAPISELPTKSQERLLLTLAQSAIELIAGRHERMLNGITRNELLTELLNQSSRSSAEIFYGVQFAINRGLLVADNDIVFLASDKDEDVSAS